MSYDFAAAMDDLETKANAVEAKAAEIVAELGSPPTWPVGVDACDKAKAIHTAICRTLGDVALICRLACNDSNCCTSC